MAMERYRNESCQRFHLLIAVSWSLLICQACGFEMLYQENKGRHEISADRVDDSEVSVRSYVLSISVCVIVT